MRWPWTAEAAVDRREPTLALPVAGELRADRYGPGDSFGSDRGWVMRAIDGGKTKAGVLVSEYTARSLPVVYACSNRISNPIARFPLRMFKSDKGKNPVQVGPDEHPFAHALQYRPNPWMSSRTVRKTVQGHALLWGNGYAEIEREQSGRAIGLLPLLPDRTRPVKDGEDFYYRTRIDGKDIRLDHDAVIHIMDQSQDGYCGISQIAIARQAVGIGLATEEFGAKFFANDAKSGGFLMHPGRLGPKARGNLRGDNGEQQAAPENPAGVLESQGGLSNAHRVKVLEEGMKFISTTIPPEDAQFLGTREFQIAEIARIYDVPLILLQSHEGTTTWGSGIEQLMIGFVRQTIDPWVDAWEQELNWKLFTAYEREQGYFVKFNMNALLRGDMAARADFYAKLFGIGGMSPNTMLALEDMDGIGPDGDNHFVQAGYVPIEQAVRPPVPPPPTPPAPKAAANDDPAAAAEPQPEDAPA